jgi:uncharacterized small protein (DUF1192 family)
MDESRKKTRDKGVAQVLLMRLEAERLPHALKLKDKVDRGERLSDFDTQFVKRGIKEGAEARSLAAKLPQYQEIVDRMARLYEEITRKGAENEQKAAPGRDR